MENKLINQSEFTLSKILKISDEGKRAVALFSMVKESNFELATITADHENYPTIQKWVREAGRSTVKIFLTMLIEDCIKSLNIQAPNKDQVIELAGELINDYPTLKPEDFKIFFTNYKKGRYGKDFHRFDMATIYQSLEQYTEERIESHEMELNRIKSEKIKKESIKGKEIPELEGLINSLSLNGKKIDPKKEFKQQLEKEAREIWKKIKKAEQPVKTVIHNGIEEKVKMSADIILIGEDAYGLPIFQSWTDFKNDYINKNINQS